MQDYRKYFKKSLINEDMGQINMSPSQEFDSDVGEFSGSDEEAWATNNPNIADNDELNSQFDVDGLDGAEIEKYSEIINKWGDGIDSAIGQLKEIIKFAAGEKLAAAPGSDQFSALIKDAPNLKRDLSAFKSQVEDLEETVKLAINAEAKERRTKIDSLN